MPSKISDLVQTIVQLREIQNRERAQKLAEQMAPFQQSLAQAQALGGLQNISQGMRNPSALQPFSGQLAPAGTSGEILSTIFGETAPSVATTRGAAVAAGRNNPAASQLDQHAAQQELTGTHETPASQFSDKMFTEAMSHLDTLPPDQQQQMILGFLQRQATGQDLTSAALDRVFTELTPEEQKLALKVKQGTALSAAEQAQLALGYTNAKTSYLQVVSQSAADGARAQAALAEVQARYGQAKAGVVNDVLFKRDALLQNLLKSSATQTPEGKVLTNQQINAYNEQLRSLAPDVYGPNGRVPLVDIPIGSTVGTTGVGNAVTQTLRNK